MGHFAEIDENNIVLRVLVDHHSGTETERINFFKSLFGDDTNWVKTSYNTEGGKHAKGKTPFRKNYAGIGYTYDSSEDAFIPPKPHTSWVRDLNTGGWKPPAGKETKPNETDIWDDDTNNWKSIF